MNTRSTVSPVILEQRIVVVIVLSDLGAKNEVIVIFSSPGVGPVLVLVVVVRVRSTKRSHLALFPLLSNIL